MDVFNTEMAMAQASASLASAKTIQPASDSLTEARQAAQDFESMMIEEMLKSMRKANESLAEEGLFGSREQDFWQDFQDSRLAMEMSRGQGLGLADQLVAQIERSQGKL